MRVPRPNLLTVLIALLVVVVVRRPFADLDFTWQVRTGEQIVRTGDLRVEDELTYTIAGQELPDFEWLYEVVLWAVWSTFGYAGLHLLKAACIIAPLALVCMRLRREGIGWHMVYLLIIVAVLALMPTWNLRPLYVTTIGLLLLSGWLHDHCTGRRSLSWEVPLLMLIWSNCHPGVVTGQGLLLGAIAWEWINRWWKWNTPLDTAACQQLTLFGLLGLAASLICPDPVERLRYTFNPDLAHPIMRGFTEMMPLHWRALRPPYLFGLVYLAVLPVFWLMLRVPRQFRLWEVALLVGLAGLASMAVRSAQDFLLVTLAVGWPRLVAYYRAAAPRRVPRPIWHTERFAKRLFTLPALRFQPSWAIATLTATLLTLLGLGIVGIDPAQQRRDWPANAADYVAAEKLHGNFFADPNVGAYLVWRRGPENVRCYADTRGFFFPPERLEDVVIISRMEAGWSQRLHHVIDAGTDYFLLSADPGVNGTLTRCLARDIRPPYADDQVVLFTARQVSDWLSKVD